MPEAERSTVPVKVLAGAKEKGKKMTANEVKAFKFRENYAKHGRDGAYRYEINARTGKRYRIKKGK